MQEDFAPEMKFLLQYDCPWATTQVETGPKYFCRIQIRQEFQRPLPKRFPDQCYLAQEPENRLMRCRLPTASMSEATAVRQAESTAKRHLPVMGFCFDSD